MRRKVYAAIHKEAQYSELTTDAQDVFISFSPEFELIARQTNEQQKQALQQAITRLSHRQREAITLLYIEELSYSEVSAIMLLKVRSVYNLIHTALESLRKQLTQSGLWAIVALLVVH